MPIERPLACTASHSAVHRRTVHCTLGYRRRAPHHNGTPPCGAAVRDMCEWAGTEPCDGAFRGSRPGDERNTSRCCPWVRRRGRQ